MKNKYCFVIVGPTAVGKTYFAIELARHFNTQIISADSRQCYKELNIGVAKPSCRQLENIKHYFINTHSVHQPVSAKLFEAYATDAVNTIFEENDIAVMVGGTGLYVRAFCEGIDEMPAIHEDVRNSIVSAYEAGGIQWLQNEVEREDPRYFAQGEIKNPQRLMRALEVKRCTGVSILDFQKKQKKEHPFKIIKIGLELPREALYRKINDRVDAMMEQGLLDEVTALLPYQKLSALNTVGYTELFDHLHGKASLDESVDAIKLNTRHYAKRQLTWFNKDKEVIWLNAAIDSRQFIDRCLELLVSRHSQEQ